MDQLPGWQLALGYIFFIGLGLFVLLALVLGIHGLVEEREFKSKCTYKYRLGAWRYAYLSEQQHLEQIGWRRYEYGVVQPGPINVYTPTHKDCVVCKGYEVPELAATVWKDCYGPSGEYVSGTEQEVRYICKECSKRFYIKEDGSLREF